MITGDKEARQKLKEINKQSKAAFRKASRAGCKVTAARAKSAAPVLANPRKASDKVVETAGQLRDSIKVRAMPRSRKWFGTTVRATAFYAGFVEYGTKHQAARKWMHRAADSVRTQVVDTTTDTFKKEMGK